MRPIPQALRKQMSAETPSCARYKEGMCQGRMTIEHAFGRTNQKRWQLIWLCWRCHLGDRLDKELNRHLAYQQATEQEIKDTFPKTFKQHLQAKKYLSEKYGRTNGQ